MGTLPAVVVGLLVKDLIGNLFHSPLFAAGGLLVTALVLFSTRRVPAQNSLPTVWSPQGPPLVKCLLVGFAQALAILPGISRSGSTIAASLWLGIPRAEAARFSFLLSLPAITGALVLELAQGGAAAPAEVLPMLGAAFVAFAVGLLAIRWTALAVVQSHFWKFGFYCLVVGRGPDRALSRRNGGRHLDAPAVAKRRERVCTTRSWSRGLMMKSLAPVLMASRTWSF